MGKKKQQAEHLEADQSEVMDDMETAFDDEETLEDVQQQLSEVQTKVADYWDQLVRTKAEIENVKRRAQRDVENARKYAVEKFASDLLPVVDSLESGFESSKAATDVNAIREGMEMTNKMLINTLERQGLIQVHPHGEKFNPEYHEAMAMVQSAEVAVDHVITVFQKGYQLNGRLVRPARVVVSRGQEDVPAIDEQV